MKVVGIIPHVRQGPDYPKWPFKGLVIQGARVLAVIISKSSSQIQHKIGELIVAHWCHIPDNKVHGANMGPTWVLSAPRGPHVGPMNLAIRDGIEELTHHQFNQWLVPCLALSHYLNHGWHIVNLTLGNNIHWNLNQNANNFIEENAFEYAICKMLATLRPKYINIAHANNSAHYLYVLVFPVWFP